MSFSRRSDVPHASRLSPPDRCAFSALRKLLCSRENRYNRNHRIATLQSSLAAIAAFCVRGEQDDGIRCLVCGICRLGDDLIAVNTQQLCRVIAKSKSSVNGAFAMMNYGAVPAGDDEITRLCAALPYLATHRPEIRQWTIRRAGDVARAQQEAPRQEGADALNGADDADGGILDDRYGFDMEWEFE